MTIQGQLLSRAAICTATMTDNSSFVMSDTDLESSMTSVGDEVRVRVTKRGVEEQLKPVDSAVFNTVLAPEGQVIVPNRVTEKLELEPGDLINYIVVPSQAFPGLTDGPLRERLTQEDDEEQEEVERPSREARQATYSDQSMRQTGQIKVPSNVMDQLGLIQGDEIFVEIEWQGEQTSFDTHIGTGNRFTIRKKQREKVGLQEVLNDNPQPTVTIHVSD